MVSISQALETAVAAIILIVLVTVFFSVFGSTECEGFANTTAIDITNAINRAALEDGVRPWTEGGAPSDDDTDYYVPVQIRLCEVSPVQAFMAMFSAQAPTDIITYGQFPEEGFAWSEAQPFGGGAGQSVLNYAIMKYGIKSMGWFQKYGTKFVKIVANGAKRAVMYPWTDFLIQKVQARWNDFMSMKAVEKFRKLLRGSNELSNDVQNRESVLNEKFFTRENQGFLKKVQTTAKDGQLDEHQAILESSVLKGEDGKLETFIDPEDGIEKYIVTTEARDFIENLKAVAGKEDKEFLDKLYIQPKFSTLGEKVNSFKATVWMPLKNWVMDSRAKQYTYDVVSSVYKKITGWYQGAKVKFNSIFNFKESMADSETLAIQTGNLKKIALRTENKELVRQDVIERIATDADLKSELAKLAGKTIDDANDITDDLIVKYISSQTRAQALKNLVLVLPRDLDKASEIAAVATTRLGKDAKTEINRIVKLQKTNPSKAQEDLVALQKEYQTPWDDFQGKGDFMEKISEGYKINGQDAFVTEEIAKEVYESTRLSMAKRGVFSMSASSSGLKSAAQSVQNDLYYASLKQSERYSAASVIDYFNMPIVDSSNIDQFAGRKAATYFWQRTKRGVLLDLNRIGQGYDPVTGTVPISFAAFNIIPGEFAIKKALNQETDDCGSNELCKITKGQATGATDSMTSYPFDNAVEGNLQVKLYRPKPGIGDRTPIGVNTALLYSSVSGCSDPTTCPDESPNFYVVSPCFATAKVWKSADGTIFVSLEKEKKCDVGSCEQSTISINMTVPETTLPFIGIQTPSYYFGDMQVTPTSADTPNYCYADAEYIWGEDLTKGNLLTTGDVPSEITHFAAYGICAGACTAALTIGTAGTGTAAAIRSCLKPCAMVEIGVLFGEATLATREYAEVSSWERQSSGWGYWNYQKATDICDWLDGISSLGGKGFAGAKTAENLFFKTSTGSKVWTAGSKLSGLGVGMTDICYGLQLIGDTSLSWPIKTPQPEFWKKAATLNEQCMRDSADKCVFLEKCTSPSDCDEGWSCIESVCKKVSQ